jgi:putative transposase
MPTYRRARIPGGTYFFTVVTAGRRSVLCHDAVRVALRDAIVEIRRTLPFVVEGWVLLPDHIHCVWTLPAGDTDFSRRWGLIKARVTQHITCSAPGISRSPAAFAPARPGLWQRRFWEHLIRDEADLEVHLDYLHYNPVKHGYVAAPHQWPWSSLHRLVAQGLYPEGWGSSAPPAGPLDGFGE